MKKLLFIASILMASFMSAQTKPESAIVDCLGELVVGCIGDDVERHGIIYKVYPIKIGEFNEENQIRFMSIVDSCSNEYVVKNDWKYNRYGFLSKTIVINHDGREYDICFSFYDESNNAFFYVLSKINP